MDPRRDQSRGLESRLQALVSTLGLSSFQRSDAKFAWLLAPTFFRLPKLFSTSIKFKNYSYFNQSNNSSEYVGLELQLWKSELYNDKLFFLFQAPFQWSKKLDVFIINWSNLQRILELKESLIASVCNVDCLLDKKTWSKFFILNLNILALRFEFRESIGVR